MEPLKSIGEHEAIRRLVGMLGHHPDVVEGAGDDCAVCRMPGTDMDQVFTTDPVIENIHFLPGDDGRRVGNKAAGRVLSDIAAMGAHPQWMLVNVVAPPEMDMARLEAAYAGMRAACDRAGATLIGGDLAQGSVFELHLFATGVLPAGAARLRSGAKSGDILCVTGPLGCSAAGHHLDFMPRVEEGIFLRESGCVHAMMDISDGLATDLRHIMFRSSVGADLNQESIPCNGTVEQALFDGEDFELLLAVPPERMGELDARWSQRFESRLAQIGVVTNHPNVLRLEGGGEGVRLIDARAFEHFSDR